MARYPYRLLNVFTAGEDRLSGNPLCVFEDGRGLSDAAMQRIARQFNLSETTFVLPATAPGATARVRIFTPSFEMPFAGHPTLGTAHVVRELESARSSEARDRTRTPEASSCGDSVHLEMQAGVVDVAATGSSWTLRAVQEPRVRAHEASRSECAAMLGVGEDAFAGDPLWVDTGAEQLIVPLARAEDVRRMTPSGALLVRHAFSPSRREAMAYVWARESEEDAVARFFFVANGSVVEDPATGSACANLGGWMLATKAPLPLRLRVRQGEAVGRPSVLRLHVDAERRIFVQGDVIELGRGAIEL